MTLGIKLPVGRIVTPMRSLAPKPWMKLNSARRELQQSMIAEAELIVRDQGRAVADRYGVCLFDPGLAPGDHRHRRGPPARTDQQARHCLSRRPETPNRTLCAVLRARFPELHIRDALDAVASRHPEMLARFGGHAMAAGLSIPACSL